MNIKEFRQQYPEYNHVDDQTLANKLYEKHYSHTNKNEFMSKFIGSVDNTDEFISDDERQFAEQSPNLYAAHKAFGETADSVVEAVKNTPKSFSNMVGGIKDLIVNSPEIASNLWSNPDVNGQSYRELLWNAVKDDYAKTYGSADGFRNTFEQDPMRVLSDASMVVGGASVPLKLSGASKAASAASKAGAVLEPLNATIGAVKTVKRGVQGASKAAERWNVPNPINIALGSTTSTGPEVIAAARRGSQTFIDNMRNPSGQAIIDKTIETFNKVDDIRRTGYEERFNQFKEFDEVIDVGELSNKADELFAKFDISPQTKRVEVTPKTSISEKYNIAKQFDEVPNGYNFKESILQTDKQGRKAINDAITSLNYWKGRKNVTPKDVERFKQQLDRIDVKYDSPAGKIISELRDESQNLVRKSLKDKDAIKLYDDMNSEYKRLKELREKLKSTFSEKSKSPDTTVKKIMSSLKDNFEMRGELFKSLTNEGVDITDLTDMISGYSLSSFRPSGVVGKTALVGGLSMIDPHFLAMIATTSPGLVGRFFTFLGAPKRATQKMLSSKGYKQFRKAYSKETGAQVRNVGQRTGQYTSLIEDQLQPQE